MGVEDDEDGKPEQRGSSGIGEETGEGGGW